MYIYRCPVYIYIYIYMHICIFFERGPLPPGRGGERTPLEEFVPGASRGVLFLQVLDQGT